MEQRAVCPTPWKVRYLTEVDADRNVKDIKNHGGKAGNKKMANLLASYLCLCDFWHIGHNKFKTKRSTRFARGRQ